MTEEINIGIVDGEIKKDGSSASVKPRVCLKIIKNHRTLSFRIGQIFHIATASIRAHLAAYDRSVDCTRRLIVESILGFKLKKKDFFLLKKFTINKLNFD